MISRDYYFCIYKPFNVLSQFTKEAPHHVTLKDVFSGIPFDVYPVGRLDSDSEGLLVLTNDNRFKTKVLHPDSNIPKTYFAQVEGIVHESALEKLRVGVEIRVNKKLYVTKPARVRKLDHTPNLPERIPPIRYRAQILTSWIELTIHEGKNRQIRRMCARVGFPVLRLVRTSVGSLSIGAMQPGDIDSMTKEKAYFFMGLSSEV
jgi:23S rRNA pseudouridine2457 synthase